MVNKGKGELSVYIMVDADKFYQKKLL